MRLACCLLFLSYAVLAADPLSDPEYLQATPLERIEGLFAHKWSGRELVKESILRYMHSQGGGTPAGEFNAFHALMRVGKEKRWRITMNEHAGILNWYFFATVTQSPAWEQGDPLARLKMLVALQKDGMLSGHLQERLVLRTMCEFLHEQSRAAVPTERARARLRALDQLTAIGVIGPDEFTPKLKPTIEAILVEYFLNDPAASKLSAAAKWEHLNEVVRQHQINQWVRSELELMIVPFGLKADAEFMGRDATGREAHIKQLVKDGKVTRFSEQYLLKRLVRPDKGVVQDMEDFLAEQPGYTEASPALKLVKISQLLREKIRFPGKQFDARIRLLHAQHTLSSEDGRLNPPLELERLRALRELEVDGRKPLRSFAHNTMKDSMVLPLYGFLMDDAAFQNADPEEQFRTVIELTNQNIGRFSGVLELMLMDYVLPRAVNVPPGKRGLARMRSLASLGKAGFDQNSLPLKHEAEHAFRHFLTFDDAYTRLTVKEKIRHVNRMKADRLLMGFTSDNLHRTVTIPALKADPAFQQADAAGKTAILEDLVQSRLLRESRVSYLKSVLCIRE